MAIDIKEEYFNPPAPTGTSIEERYYASGGDDGKNNPKPQRMNFQQINEWNKFMDENKDGGDLTQLFTKYLQANPKTSLTFDSLRNELDMLNNRVRSDASRKHELFDKDGHTGNRFIHLRNLDNNEDLGAMNGDGVSERNVPVGKMPDTMIHKSVPDWVQELHWSQDWQMPYYLDGDTMIYVDKSFYNSPRFLKTQKK